MKNETDFLTARGQIATKISKLENELKYWRDELATFDRVETTIRRLNTESNGEPKKFKLVATVANIPQQKPETDTDILRREEVVHQFQSGNRKRGAVKRLVLKTVRDVGGNAISSKDVERAILKEGYKPNGKNFGITVYKTLNNLAEKGKIVRTVDGRNIFFHAKAK